MIKTPRQAAEGLFKRAEPEGGSDAAKLRDIRDRQVLRAREGKVEEMQQRLRKRNATNDKPAFLFR